MHIHFPLLPFIPNMENILHLDTLDIYFEVKYITQIDTKTIKKQLIFYLEIILKQGIIFIQ